MKRLFQVLYNFYAILLYLILMVLVSPLILASTLFSQPVKGNVIFVACKYWSSVWFVLVGIRYKKISLQPELVREPCIFVANHRSYLDVVSLVRLIDRPTRVLARHDIAELPLLGHFYGQAVVSVNRDNPMDKAASVIAISEALAQGLSIFIFPEGTFNESSDSLSSFYSGAFKMAIDNGVPIQPVLFLDNLDRMSPLGFLKLSPGVSRTVIMRKIDVKGYTKKDVSRLKDMVWNQMSDQILKYQNGCV
ncbi:1-acyl-sn-glycerol-3-phosphate acyltransferase [Dyadobacter sp. CY312]|uniref:lysophospholipid acyltransferase family protein n=1 Tax=Dyadobacter sp. CY312 TaxID=2907303 RepID=UPI001F2F2B14|nr:lysophospholipid acyltransferase family protein [Dyadobacter sp. CY312]MCE7044568.1 1-acyl-sn-glycerol-3-phosphate acyltransferase [Dyadobacter sp. CY312]